MAQAGLRQRFARRSGGNFFAAQKGKLPGLGGLPKFQAGGTSRLSPGQAQAASALAVGCCKLCSKSAARCACEAAVKIARLSSFRTLTHDAI